MLTKQITNILRKEGLLSKHDSLELREYEKLNQGNVLDFCIERNIADPEKLFSLLQQMYAIPLVDLDKVVVDPASAKLLPSSLCFEHMVLPFQQHGQTLYVAAAHPDDQQLISFISQKTGKSVALYVAQRHSIKKALEAIFNISVQDSQETILELIKRAQKLTHEPETMAKEGPIIALLDHLIIFALRSKASDMHVEPHENGVLIRCRVDGLLHEFFTLPRELLASLIARLKIISQLRIDEQMRPQDGRFSFHEAGFDVAVRVSMIPTLHGTKATLRFLDTKSDQLSLDGLGFSKDHRTEVDRLLKRPNGLILVTGPTGSGKTTTLYAMVKTLTGQKMNISTIEDPIEYHLSGANQIQVNTQADLTFANGLRSILRQDPDVIMVGEIRDKETATIAINAALTGHLVLSSLHTNSAAGAVTRLIDMGIEPFLIASILRAVIGQRLVRKICPSCRAEIRSDEVPTHLAPYYHGDGVFVMAKGNGCKECLGTGYKDRLAVFELLSIDDSMHQLIIDRADTKSIEGVARRLGMRSMVEDGLDKVVQQLTTPEEITRVLQ